MRHDADMDELRRAHAAQLDALLEENARLRQALEGRIDPRLFGATSLPVSTVRRLGRRVVPKPFHPPIARLLKRFQR